MILDSGERRSFDTGAVRDIQAGKGKPSFMPLEVAALLTGIKSGEIDDVIYSLAYFAKKHDTRYLYTALYCFADIAYNKQIETMLLEVSIHYEEGAKKYGPDNWRKGIPTSCYLDSAIRHYLKYRRGDQDEPHDRAFVWNIMCCIWEVDYHENTNH